MKNAVAIQDLQFNIAGKTILDIPAWSLKHGDHALILGDSGSGKTSLLNLLAGLRHPSAGALCVDDQNLANLSLSALDQFRGKHIGIVFQSLHLISALSVLQNLMLAQSLAGQGQDESRALAVLDSLGLKSKATAKTNELSGGQAQRVAIARAVINRPTVILADEPTSALDDKNTERVLNLLKEQAGACEASLIIATHDKRLMDRFDNQLTLETQL